MPFLCTLPALLRGPWLKSWVVLLATVLACHSSSNLASGDGSKPQLASLRIVSLHDVSTEIVVGLGLGSQLVGLEELVDPLPALRSAVSQVPRVSSLESIVALQPTHVVGLEITPKRSPELVKRLKTTGIALSWGKPTRLIRSIAFIKKLATTFGRQSQGEKLWKPLQAELDGESSAPQHLEIRVDHSGGFSAQPPAPTQASPAVFIYDCCEPPFSAGNGGLLHELLERAGARNIFSDLNADWASVSWEEVVARKPDLVIIHSYDYEGQKDVASKRAALRKIPGLKNIPTAVLPLGCTLGGLRSLEGLQRLRTAIGELQQ